MRKEKILDILSTILTTLIIIGWVWLIVSWLNVVFYRPNISKWNLFNFIVVSHAEADRNISYTALEEQAKGERQLKFIAEFMIDEKNLDILARIIETEVGASYLPDYLSYEVGSVFLNRVNSPLFPNTFYEVAHQQGQYANAGSSVWYNEPSDRSKQIAQELLEHGSCLPPEVIWQANFPQGKGVYIYHEGIYFCY